MSAQPHPATDRPDLRYWLRETLNQMLADGRATMAEDGTVTFRDLTDEEVASGEYPLARLLPAGGGKRDAR